MCQSFGDPHISPFSVGRPDLIRPGSHQPGTYTLSRTGQKTYPNYLLIQADQQLCPKSNATGVYCNKRAVVKAEGHVIEIGCNKIVINGVEIPIFGTYHMDNVSITKKGRGEYLVDYPNGNTRTACPAGTMDITVIITGGQKPNGGVCTQFSGDQSLNTTLSSNFFLSCTYLIICRVWNNKVTFNQQGELLIEVRIYLIMRLMKHGVLPIHSTLLPMEAQKPPQTTH